ncbi:DNA polymerase III subunit gamma/tau [Acinetobacter sp. Ver3]|uniref:DNA polymerase III subunit gamma/tau n=1 Tax=Acinetobacter sp. Ver3 TaxID=466088 RepID=UPI00045121EE|nr:DNA polymerase III subunit gamma/tau [Acinetobacter sp. Ver3]EZQ10907.1 DNA polymerase III [Acinetobacter sp. Ver3]
MYQVLARKYRPRNFLELVGQNHVSRALTSALERGRLHHAYLFTGTRGVGKTTIARILAKCLNCETGVTSTPCEVCPTCTAINEGRFIDLIEIDAASRTKVEDTRELLDNVPYAPTQGRFKVYLIDEVHMLSTHSFNALLKTLEEPPEHVKFLFATTDPQKLPITVISRCLQFTLRPLAVDEITSHLTQILTKESINAEADAIWQIAESAQGSLRDALSLTDQAIAYGQGAIHHQDVKEMLGLIDRTIIFDLILAIHQNQRAKVSALLLQFRQQALDVSLVLDQLISTLHELALLQYLPDLSLKYSAEINQKIMQLSSMISAQDLQLYYQIACKGRAELQIAVTQEQGFEMCVLRLLAFRPMANNEQLTTQAPPEESNVLKEAENFNQISTENSESIPADHQEAGSKISSPENNTSLIQPSRDVNDEENTDLILFQQMMASDDEVIPAESIQPEKTESESLHSTELNHADDVGQSVSVEVKQENLTNSVVGSEEIELTSFGASFNSEPVESSIVDQDNIFFLEPKPNELSAESAELSVQEEGTSNGPHFQSLDLPDENKIVVTDVGLKGLMPQDILKLEPVELEGEWDTQKWEYWFRNSPLTPAVQELAQQGLMQGQIDGTCEFYIPAKYEALLHSLIPSLEAALKQSFLKSQLIVKYNEPNGETPFDLQEKRKQKAYRRAEELIHQEPVVEDLLKTFGGELHNIQLKS